MNVPEFRSAVQTWLAENDLSPDPIIRSTVR